MCLDKNINNTQNIIDINIFLIYSKKQFVIKRLRQTQNKRYI